MAGSLLWASRDIEQKQSSIHQHNKLLREIARSKVAITLQHGRGAADDHLNAEAQGAPHAASAWHTAPGRMTEQRGRPEGRGRPTKVAWKT